MRLWKTRIIRSSELDPSLAAYMVAIAEYAATKSCSIDLPYYED